MSTQQTGGQHHDTGTINYRFRAVPLWHCRGGVYCLSEELVQQTINRTPLKSTVKQLAHSHLDHVTANTALHFLAGLLVELRMQNALAGIGASAINRQCVRPRSGILLLRR